MVDHRELETFRKNWVEDLKSGGSGSGGPNPSLTLSRSSISPPNSDSATIQHNHPDEQAKGGSHSSLDNPIADGISESIKPFTSPSTNTSHQEEYNSASTSESTDNLKTLKTAKTKRVSESSHTPYLKNEPVKSGSKDSKHPNKFQPFLIADQLLKVDSTQISLGNLHANEEAREEFTGSRNKRLKLCSQPSEHDNQRDCDSFLDIFLSDLEEINEIPFFESTLARELAIQIFQYLEPLELCRCSQVSKAWKSLAEDELLWSRICHYLGYDESHKTVEKTNWKQIVKEHVLRERQLRHNWKMRYCEVSPLDYVTGGILCAASSWQHQLVAGYSNGELRVWEEEDDYTLSPSNTALVINEAVESGTVSNMVNQVCVNNSLVAASYIQGNVDVWDLSLEHKNPTETLHLNKPIKNLSCSRTNRLAFFSSDHEIWSYQPGVGKDTTSFTSVETDSHISGLCIVPESTHEPLLAVCACDQVKLHRLGHDPGDMTILHNTIGQAVSCIDCDPQLLALGISSDDEYFVKLYDLQRMAEKSKLLGHRWTVSVINMLDTPPNSLVTGGSDRKVRVYDTRGRDPVIVLCGHAGVVTCVQMDDWKVASGSNDGMVVVWDQRMASKLWEQHNRHAVGYLVFRDHVMYTANIPADKHPVQDNSDTIYHRRYRGSLCSYDFSVDLSRHPALPSNVLSTYDEPERYNYNIGLAVPYN